MRKFVIGAIALLAATGVVTVAMRPARATAGDARHELALSLSLLEAGNYSAAHNHAQSAIKADDSWGLAHAVLARIMLAMGDGIGAEGELARAKSAGFDVANAHQLYAHAYLLEGNPQRAIDEAKKSLPRYGGYANRVVARALAAEGDMPGAQQTLAAVLAANPDNSLGWSDLGRIRYSSGDYAGAIDATERALKIDPGNLEALTLRGELVRGQYGLVAALPWFESALRYDAYYHPALIEYAATLGEAGRYTDMLSATRRALDARPGSPQALYLLAVLAGRAGKYDLARAMLQHIGDALNDLPGALLLGGVLDYHDGAYEQAIEKWRALVAQQPMNITARRLLGSALLRSGDARGALDVLRPVALRGDADSYSLDLVGRAFERTGERDWAAKFLDRASFPARDTSTPFGTDDSLPTLAGAAQQAPDDPVLTVGYLRGLIENGDNAGALAEAERLATANPGAPAAQLLVGDMLTVMQRYGDAAAAYRRAADIRFDEPTMLRLVDALDRAGHRPEAANVLALYMSQNPQSVAAQRLAAHWQIAAGQWQAAIDTLEGLRTRVGSRDAALLSELAFAYLGDGQDDLGTAYAKAAYRIAPLNPAATDAYGWALYQAGNNDGASQLLEKAASIAPEHSVIHWHLAQVYADMDRNEDARAQVQAALRDPTFTDRDAAAALLKTLV